MGENFMDIWAQALEILKSEVSPVGYKTYVEVMVPRLVDESTLCFLSPSNYHIDICKKRYLDLIENTLTFLTKKSYHIIFEAKEIIPEANSNNDNFDSYTNDIVDSQSTKENNIRTRRNE